MHNDAVSNLSFTVNVTFSSGLSCLFFFFFVLIPLDVCRFSFFFSFPLLNRKRCMFWSPQKSFTRSKSLTPLFLTKRWQNSKLAILLFCLVYYTSGDSSKNWEVGEFQKRKQLRQLMSTFGFRFYVTYQCLRHKLRLEASAVEECFDAALFFCCKKNISGDKIINCDKLRNIIKTRTSSKNQLPMLVISSCSTVTTSKKATWTCFCAITCVVWTHSLLKTGSQLCSSSEEEIKHICFPCLLRADKTRNTSQKNWNMNCLGVGYSHFSLSWYWSNNNYYWEIHFLTSLQVMENYVM